jgi:hypothetical protein
MSARIRATHNDLVLMDVDVRTLVIALCDDRVKLRLPITIETIISESATYKGGDVGTYTETEIIKEKNPISAPVALTELDSCVD